MLVVAAAAITISSSCFITPALASDLTVEDQMSLQDPLQSRVTICHIPEGDVAQAHDITVGESVVPNHLAHGDRIGRCLLTQQPAIAVELPTSCISTENGLVSYARVVLSGFPVGLVVIMGPEASGFPLLLEMQAETQSVPVGFPLGEKTLTAFADVNRNLLQDPGEASAAVTFAVTCW